MLDSFGRTIDYLRISVTDKCNLRCTYCMPACGVEARAHADVLRIEEFLDVVRVAAEHGITKVRLTGGEPLVRRGIVELVRGIAQIPGIAKIGMTTNGILLSLLARPLREAGLTHLNVSIDTLDPVRYAEVTRGGDVRQAIAGVLAARGVGFREIKINTVVAADRFAEVGALRQFCSEYGLTLQRIAEYRLAEEKRDGLTVERPLPCSACNRLRLLSTGVLKPCLHSNDEIPIDWNDIAGSLEAAVAAKPYEGSVCTNRSMMEIGG